MISWFLLGTLALAPTPNLAREDSTAWQTLRLKNGIPLTVVVVPDAPRQHFFTFLPHGLLADTPGHPQFAHLFEHLSIRSTDPESLSVDGIEINGETDGIAMRLDTYARPDRWREAMERHARWIHEWRTLAALDPAVLAREKERIRAEEEATTRTGFTHKWALAAWAQVARFGAASVPIHGAVAAATPEDLREDLRARPHDLGGVSLATVGPTPPEAVLEAAEALFGELDVATPFALARATSDPKRPGPRKATWDLATDHYLAAFPLPDDDLEDRLAGAVLAQALQSLGAGRVDANLHLVVGADLVVPEGRWLTFSCHLPEGTAPREIEEAIAGLLDDLRKRPALLETSLRNLRAELAQEPDFATLRRQMAAQGVQGRALELLEGNLVLAALRVERLLEAPRSQLAEAAAALTPERLRRILTEHLQPKHRSTLILRRGGSPPSEPGPG